MTMAGGMLVAYNIIMLFTLALSITFYIFSSLGLYSHAKRLGINNPWLSWIPVGNYWVSGKLADKASANNPNKKLNYTKWLMSLSIAMFAGLFLVIILVAILTSMIVMGTLDYSPASATGAVIVGILLLIVYLAIYAASIALLVIWSIGMYHVYRIYCTKGMSVAFAILGGVFGLHGIFLFAIRNKPFLPPEPPQPIYTTYQNVPPQGYYPPQN